MQSSLLFLAFRTTIGKVWPNIPCLRKTLLCFCFSEMKAIFNIKTTKVFQQIIFLVNLRNAQNNWKVLIVETLVYWQMFMKEYFIYFAFFLPYSFLVLILDLLGFCNRCCCICRSCRILNHLQDITWRYTLVFWRVQYRTNLSIQLLWWYSRQREQ